MGHAERLAKAWGALVHVTLDAPVHALPPDELLQLAVANWFLAASGLERTEGTPADAGVVYNATVQYLTGRGALARMSGSASESALCTRLRMVHKYLFDP